MQCECGNFESANKKSFSNHHRWHEGKMDKTKYKGINLGEKNGMWIGDKVKYQPLHSYIKRHLPKPKLCQDCLSSPSHDLANKGIYNRMLSNWEWLCRKCHMKKDGRLVNLIKRNKQKK